MKLGNKYLCHQEKSQVFPRPVSVVTDSWSIVDAPHHFRITVSLALLPDFMSCIKENDIITSRSYYFNILTLPFVVVCILFCAFRISFWGQCCSFPHARGLIPLSTHQSSFPKGMTSPIPRDLDSGLEEGGHRALGTGSSRCHGREAAPEQRTTQS